MDEKYSPILVAILIVLTGATALSVHLLFVQYFTPPVINIDPKLNEMMGFIIRFATVIGAVLIYHLSKNYWIRLHPFHSVILFAILMMGLTEQLFRAPLMESIVGGTPWVYQILAAMPSYAGYLTLSLLICLLMPLIILKKNNFIFFKYTVFAVSATAAVFFIRKVSNYSLSPLLASAPQIDMTKLIYPPYGWDILVPAYITFLEPTIASFMLFYLVNDALSKFNTFIKGLVIGGILIIIHGGIYSFVQIACSEGNILFRIFYYGQFLWEYIVLGVLTAYSFMLYKNSCIFLEDKN